MYNFYNIEKYKQLSSEELERYFKQIKLGNKEVRNFIIQNNFQLVIKFARKYRNTYIEEDDLINIGAIGLIKAVDTFDIEKNIKFCTYAAKCINNEILIFLRNNKKNINVISLEEQMTNKMNNQTFKLSDTLQDFNINIEKDYDEYETNLIIQEILYTLNDREREILQLYFGIGLERRYKQREIAEIMNLSQSDISRCIRKAIYKIKNNQKSKSLVLTLYH